jgi:hypothetical protein
MIATLALCLAFAPAIADTGGLISALTSQLGVTQEQATGGAGSIVSFARDQLSGDDFGTLAKAVPGLDALADSAPKGSTGGGLLSGAVNQLGGTAKLADQFAGLGLDPSYVQQYLPIVLDYVEQTGGEAAKSILAGVF